MGCAYLVQRPAGLVSQIGLSAGVFRDRDLASKATGAWVVGTVMESFLEDGHGGPADKYPRSKFGFVEKIPFHCRGVVVDAWSVRDSVPALLGSTKLAAEITWVVAHTGGWVV